MDKMEEGNVETQPHAKAEYKLPNPIIGKVPGTTEIVLVESISRHVGRFQNALPFYKGKVRCGDDELAFTEAAVLAFQIHEGGRVLSLHHCLSLFQHPCLMNSLGYGYGTGEHEGFVFLAFPWFQSTFMDFMDKSCKNTVDLERFSEDFIRLVTCIVYGLIELHSYNYYCPNLSGKQILVLKEHNSVFAKLWGFCPLELGNEKGKDMDWVRLGQILRKTAKNHKSYTIEIADLCERMMQGTLKGIHILKHAALLSVRFKFDNILALNIFALAHFTKSNETPDKANLHCSASDQDNTVAMNEFFCESSDKNKTIAAFKILLDSDVGWKEKLPLWIKERIKKLRFPLPTCNTFRGFLWQIRCLIEHENSYVPPEEQKKIASCVLEYSSIQPDLEYVFRRSWSHLFLTAQKFATSLQLKNS